MLMHVVVMRKATLDVEDIKNVDLIQMVSDDNIHIREVNATQPDGYVSHNYNPHYNNVYICNH